MNRPPGRPPKDSTKTVEKQRPLDFEPTPETGENIENVFKIMIGCSKPHLSMYCSLV